MAVEPTTATLDTPAASDKAPAEYMADAMSDFAELDAGRPAPSIKAPEKPAAKAIEKPATKPETAGRDDKGKFVPRGTEKPEGDKPEAPETKPAGAEKPVEEPKPTRMRELGERYDALKKQIDTDYKPKIEKLIARVAELESVEPVDAKPLQQKISTLEARNKTLEEQIEYLDYQQSTDYRTKYQEPYAKAYAEAVAEFKELRINQEGLDQPRVATEQDLLELANMPVWKMDSVAQEWFGASAARVINHIQNLKRLAHAQQSALEEAKGKSGERLQQRQAEAQAKGREAGEHWKAVNDGLKEKFPKAYTAEEGNVEDAAAHAKGFALADLLFTGGAGLTPEQIETLPTAFRDTVKNKQPLSDKQRVQLHALIRLKAANHDRKVVALQKANARIAELEKQLAEYEKSEPSGGRAGRRDSEKAGDEYMTIEQAAADFNAMDK